MKKKKKNHITNTILKGHYLSTTYNLITNFVFAIIPYGFQDTVALNGT